jgi:hypothetical protein
MSFSLGRTGPIAISQRIDLILDDDRRSDDLARAASGHQPAGIGRTTAEGHCIRASRIFPGDMLQAHDMSDLVSERPSGRSLSHDDTKDSVRVRGAAIVGWTCRTDEVGHDIKLADIVAVVEELNLLNGQLPRRTVWDDIQISQGRHDICAREVFATPNHHAYPCGAVNVLHAGQHGCDSDVRVAPNLEVQTDAEIRVQTEDRADIETRDIRTESGATLGSDDHGVTYGDDEAVFRIEGHPGPGELEAGANVAADDVVTEDVAVLSGDDQGITHGHYEAVHRIEGGFGSGKLKGPIGRVSRYVMTKCVAISSSDGLGCYRWRRGTYLVG